MSRPKTLFASLTAVKQSVSFTTGLIVRIDLPISNSSSEKRPQNQRVQRLVMSRGESRGRTAFSFSVRLERMTFGNAIDGKHVRLATPPWGRRALGKIHLTPRKLKTGAVIGLRRQRQQHAPLRKKMISSKNRAEQETEIKPRWLSGPSGVLAGILKITR